MNRWICILALGLVGSGLIWAGSSEDFFKEKKLDDFSSAAMSDWGDLALGIQHLKWKHGETEHFIIHFFRNGERIARRSEIFYGEIKAFFGNRPDLLAGQKSQVFACNDAPDWKHFTGKIQQDWAGRVTRGDGFFDLATNEKGQFDNRGKVQAHEMTHLIFNRFFREQPPLWLNGRGRLSDTDRGANGQVVQICGRHDRHQRHHSGVATLWLQGFHGIRKSLQELPAPFLSQRCSSLALNRRPACWFGSRS